MVMVAKAKAPRPTKARGTPTILPPWWLVELELKTRGKTVGEVAAAVSAMSDREQAWDRGTVGKFMKGKHPTFELMVAFCRLYMLPIPIFIAWSHAEAAHLAVESARFRLMPTTEPTPDRHANLMLYDDAREKLELLVADQGARVSSEDAQGIVGRRRTRGVGRGRKTAS